MAALNHILGLKCTLHILEPDLVNCLEKFSFSWKILCNITRCEDRHKISPKSLDLKPFFNNVSNVREKSNSVSDFSLEGGNILHGIHLIELIQVFFKLLLNVKNVTTECTWLVNTFPCLDL